MVANFELDLKKVVAYSTLRQLGFIIRILSIGSIIELVFLHLFIRAIFKSLIFICVGRYVHYIYRIQDILWNILYLSIKKYNFNFFNFKIVWFSFF